MGERSAGYGRRLVQETVKLRSDEGDKAICSELRKIKAD